MTPQKSWCEKVCLGMMAYAENNEFCDLTISCKDGTVAGHSIVFMSICPEIKFMMKKEGIINKLFFAHCIIS